jgi:hypothetical protein
MDPYAAVDALEMGWLGTLLVEEHVRVLRNCNDLEPSKRKSTPRSRAFAFGKLNRRHGCDKIFSAYNEHRRPAEIFAPAKCVPAVSR